MKFHDRTKTSPVVKFFLILFTLICIMILIGDYVAVNSLTREDIDLDQNKERSVVLEKLVQLRSAEVVVKGHEHEDVPKEVQVTEYKNWSYKQKYEYALKHPEKAAEMFPDMAHGDPQSDKYIYLFQAYIWPKYEYGIIEAPDNFTGDYRMWYENGQLWTVNTLINSEQIGGGDWFDEEGNQLGRYVPDVNDPRSGNLLALDESGNVAMDSKIENNLVVHQIAYHESGKIRYERPSNKKGKWHGPWISYYESGQVEHVSHFKNGKQYGNEINYSEDGKITRISNWDGEEEVIIYDPEDNIDRRKEFESNN